MYKLFFENNPLGSFILEKDGKMKAYNKAFLHDIGYDEHYNLLQDANFSFKNVVTEFETMSNRLEKENSILEFETYINTKDNQFKLYKINCSHFSDDSNLQLIVGTLMPTHNDNNGSITIADERKKYEDIMNNSVQLIQSFDKNGMLLFVNKSWKDTFGYSNSEIGSINMFDIISEEDQEHCNVIFQNILKGIPAFDIRATFVSKSGKKILLKGNVLPMLSNGELVATHAFFNDISELNVVKKELASKEVLLETIFKSIPVCLYLKNYEGRYLFANEMMQQTIGSEVKDKTDDDIFEANSAVLMKNTDREAIANTSKNINFSFINEINGATKYFYCGKKTISAEFDEQLIFGFAIDITDLRNKTLKVEESERILNQIVSNTNTGIMLFKLDQQDHQYKLDFINNTCKQIINYNERKLTFNEVLPQMQFNPDSNELGALKSNVYDYSVVTPERTQYYDVYINEIDLPDNNHKLLVFFNDVSEKRDMIDHLELKLNENVMLLSEVHHRVKNNLANIYGMIELNKYKFQNTNYEQYLMEVQLKIKSIAIVHELLYKSKSISKISLDLYFNELCHEYKKIYKGAHQINVNFDLLFEKNIILELGKAISLGLMLGELLSNSFKFATDNKLVNIGISIKSINGRCFMEYTDSGRGFDSNSFEIMNKGFGWKLIKNVLKQIKANFVLNTHEKFNLSLDFEQV